MCAEHGHYDLAFDFFQKAISYRVVAYVQKIKSIVSNFSLLATKYAQDLIITEVQTYGHIFTLSNFQVNLSGTSRMYGL